MYRQLFVELFSDFSAVVVDLCHMAGLDPAMVDLSALNGAGNIGLGKHVDPVYQEARTLTRRKKDLHSRPWFFQLNLNDPPVATGDSISISTSFCG